MEPYSHPYALTASCQIGDRQLLFTFAIKLLSKHEHTELN